MVSGRHRSHALFPQIGHCFGYSRSAGVSLRRVVSDSWIYGAVQNARILKRSSVTVLTGHHPPRLRMAAALLDGVYAHCHRKRPCVASCDTNA
jgi:hypothetical protein